MRDATKKNIALLIAVSVFTLLLAECVSRLYIYKIHKYRPEVFSGEAMAFYKKYSARMHHMKSIESGLACEANICPERFMFSVIKPFDIRRTNLLIQGDSWAAQLEEEGSINILNTFASVNSLGIINAGISSFSPSPMTVQLRVLREDFGIHPDIMIGIIDQTDVGDELNRYSKKLIFDKTGRLESVHAEPFNSSEIFSFRGFFEKHEIMRNSSLKLIGLVQTATLTLKYNRVKQPRRSGWDTISRVLRDGLDESGEKCFSESLDRYIEEVFRNGKVKRLVLVVHPHRNHLVANSDAYTFYVGDLVKSVSNRSRFADRIILWDGRKEFDSLYEGMSLNSIFIKGDKASHLTVQAHEIFTKAILNTVVGLQ